MSTKSLVPGAQEWSEKLWATDDPELQFITDLLELERRMTWKSTRARIEKTLARLSAWKGVAFDELVTRFKRMLDEPSFTFTAPDLTRLMGWSNRLGMLDVQEARVFLKRNQDFFEKTRNHRYRLRPALQLRLQNVRTQGAQGASH